MNTAQETTETPVVQTTTQNITGPDGAGLDQVRNLLFGSELRQYEDRFAQIETQLSADAEDLREEIRKRFDFLEVYIKQEVESLTERIKGEQSKRSESVDGIAEEVKRFTGALQTQMSTHSEEVGKIQRDLRQQINEQSQVLSDEIRRKYKESSAALEKSVRELGHNKADRAALADLFTQMAGQFKAAEANSSSKN